MVIGGKKLKDWGDKGDFKDKIYAWLFVNSTIIFLINAVSLLVQVCEIRKWNSKYLNCLMMLASLNLLECFLQPLAMMLLFP